VSKYTYVLRVCNADMTSYGGFVWPKEGIATCPDWSDQKVCGQGLHGWAMGEGEISAAQIRTDSVWMVVKVRSSKIVQLDGKVKFSRGRVVFAGSKENATTYVQKRHPGAAVIWGTATAGYAGTATAGDSGTATAGTRGTATAGETGILVLRYYDGQRFRLVVGYVGEDGIEPKTSYKLDPDTHKFIKA
jgi:hypothetical protein